MAHDTCSIAAVNIAFEDCKEARRYDLGESYIIMGIDTELCEAAWQLIGYVPGLLIFAETLLKAQFFATVRHCTTAPRG